MEAMGVVGDTVSERLGRRVLRRNVWSGVSMQGSLETPYNASGAFVDLSIRQWLTR